MLLALVVGVVIGACAGYFRGWVDEVLMRITDAFQILPNFLLLLVLVAVFGSDIQTITVAVGLVSWPPTARLTRAEFMTLRQREFVQASRTLGQGHLSIIVREILPNALPPVIIYSSVVMATAVLLESALAFLNLSDPNVASWGNLIGAGRSVMREQWYVITIPARRHPADGAGHLAGRPGAQRCPQPADAQAMSAHPQPAALLRIAGLSVALPAGGERSHALRDIGLEVAAGEVVCGGR